MNNLYSEYWQKVIAKLSGQHNSQIKTLYKDKENLENQLNKVSTQIDVLSMQYNELLEQFTDMAKSNQCEAYLRVCDNIETAEDLLDNCREIIDFYNILKRHESNQHIASSNNSLKDTNTKDNFTKDTQQNTSKTFIHSKSIIFLHTI